MKIIAALVVGLFTLIGAVVVSQKNVKLTSKITPAPTPIQADIENFEETSSVTVNTGGAAFFVSPSKATLSEGDSLIVNLMLSADNLNLSAGAIRLLQVSTSESPLRPIDKDGEKEGIQVATDSTFRAGGWSFPINEARFDEQGRLIIDIAFVNLSPEGYMADGEMTIVTVEFEALSGSKAVNLEFDRNLSKLVAKNGDEVSLNFSGATFTVE